ncbi:hypothetical protein MJM28_27245, partial [Salmonella enterica subsp. enterica serovar Montevideo]|nr:hypothetical protein [Salmonella enterica subsp. enterica serovar Montevideo]
PDLIADGQIGPRTLSALTFFLSHRRDEGEMILIRALNCSQGQSARKPESLLSIHAIPIR